MTKHPVARALLGYLLVRGGVHAVAYAKALEQLTGRRGDQDAADPRADEPEVPGDAAVRGGGPAPHRSTGSAPTTTGTSTRSGRGRTPTTASELQVADGPPEGAAAPPAPEQPENFVPGYDPGELAEIAQRMMSGAAAGRFAR